MSTKAVTKDVHVPRRKKQGRFFVGVLIALFYLAISSRIRPRTPPEKKWTKTKKEIYRWRRSTWAIIACVAFVLGAYISFSSATAAIESGTTNKKLISLLTIYVVIGLSVTGVGQLMTAAAHGAVSRGGALLDGWGKVVGVFGWSLGIVGAVMFAMKDANAPDWLLGFAVIIFIGAPALTVVVLFVQRLKYVEPEAD